MARDDMPSESEALNRLLAASSEGRVALVTSEITLREINGYQGLMRPQLEQMFEMLKKVPAVSWDDLGGVDSRDSLLGANQIQGSFWGGSLGCDGTVGFERRGVGGESAADHRPA